MIDSKFASLMLMIIILLIGICAYVTGFAIKSKRVRFALLSFLVTLIIIASCFFYMIKVDGFHF